MQDLTKTFRIGSPLLAAMALSQPVSAAVIDGIDVGPAPSGTSILASQIYETVVNTAGDTLTGVGQVTALNSNTAFDATGGQLNFVYTIKATAFSSNQAVFDAGTITFYHNAAGTFNPFGSGQTLSNQIAAIESGTNWLDGEFKTVQAPAPFDSVVSSGAIFGTGTNFGISGQDNLSGTGLGNIDITSGPGLANSYFNTDHFAITLPGGAAGTADLQFSSSFSLPGGPSFAPIVGTASFTAAPVAPVPLPGSGLLLGSGLLASVMGFRYLSSKDRQNFGPTVG